MGRATHWHSMATDAVTPTAPEGDGREVMASIDPDADGDRLVIADVTADGTWLSVREAVAASLSEWR